MSWSDELYTEPLIITKHLTSFHIRPTKTYWIKRIAEEGLESRCSMRVERWRNQTAMVQIQGMECVVLVTRLCWDTKHARMRQLHWFTWTLLSAWHVNQWEDRRQRYVIYKAWHGPQCRLSEQAKCWSSSKQDQDNCYGGKYWGNDITISKFAIKLLSDR